VTLPLGFRLSGQGLQALCLLEGYLGRFRLARSFQQQATMACVRWDGGQPAASVPRSEKLPEVYRDEPNRRSPKIGDAFASSTPSTTSSLHAAPHPSSTNAIPAEKLL